jgi:hypothetical protein
MAELSLPELEAERDRLYAQLAAVGDFRRGSVSENYRRCGKPNCACARPDHLGHGPRFLWTRTARGRGTVGRQLAAAEVEKVRLEVARHGEFAATVEQIAEANEKICEARPVAGTDVPSAPGGRKRGLLEALAREKAAEIARLAAEATSSPRSAASRPAGPKTRSGHRATRHQPPDQPRPASRSCSPVGPA